MKSALERDYFGSRCSSPVQPPLRWRTIRLAVAGVGGAATTALVIVAMWHVHPVAVLTVLAPSTFVVSAVLAYFATAPEAGAVSFQEWSHAPSERTWSHLSGHRWGQTMTVCRSGNRWFLENGHGELHEAPFDEIVEWLDTLWDIHQLGLAGPDNQPQTVLFRRMGPAQAA